MLELLRFSSDVAEGMSYLSKIQVVHRDLAARNCMLDDSFTVKVADFGLARSIYETGHYCSGHSKPLPLKWMAPECLNDRVYDIKTDVWSMGVFIWEMMSLCQEPYGCFQNNEVMPYLKKGNRLDCPDNCPIEMYKLMLNCWAAIPKERPEFSEIKQVIYSVRAKKGDVYQNQ